MEMLAKVFELYERYRQNSKIRYYGMATWTCFRVPSDSEQYLSLEQVVKTAEEVGGKQHGFRFIQLPYNLAYDEAYFSKTQTYRGQSNLTILEVARKYGIGVFTSVPLMQGRLLEEDLPEYAGMIDKATRVLQFARSTPGILAPLIGQKSPSHVDENLHVTNLPPLEEHQFLDAVRVLKQGSTL
jgi:aryl-alcohol dehydrogenase-like predicted oxidoreductase